MNILEKATAHFDAIGTKSIKVPEWDTTIYAAPFTLNDKKTLFKFSNGDDSEFMVRTLIMKAKDKNGKPVFSIEDIPTLSSHVDANVLERVVSEIVKVDSIQEAEEK